MRVGLIRRGLEQLKRDNPRLNPRNFEYVPSASYKLQIAWLALLLPVAFTVGEYIEQQEFNRMTRFRDKSALYGSEKGPDDEPSWGCKESEFKWNFSKWPRSWWY